MDDSRRRLLANCFVLLSAISSAGHAAEVNLSYGLLVDNSASSRDQLDGMIETGNSLIAANRPGDQAFILRFVGPDNLSLIQTTTRDKAALIEALDNIYAEAGEPALLDALYLSIVELNKSSEKNKDRRKGLVVMSTGNEGGSYYKHEDIVKLIGGGKLTIHFIVFNRDANKDITALNALAAKTGGTVYFPKSKADLQGSIGAIVDNLRR